MDTFEIAWFSSALAFACVVYALEPFELPPHPKDPLIPIKANGRDIRVPPAFVDIISDISKFATRFEFALEKAVPGLKSDSGTLWTARIVRGEKPELEEALRVMDECVSFFLEKYWRPTIGLCSLRHDHSALLDRAIDAYDRDTEIEEDLRGYRKKQREKMDEVQVSR